VRARPGFGHLLLVMPLVAAAAWIHWRGTRERDDPAQILSVLRANAAPTLPAPASCRATSRSQVESYDRTSLYTLIDGAAESYLARGFERCVAALYTFSESGSSPTEVTAEVYRFATPAGARELFHEEAPSQGRAVAGVADAVTDGTVLLAVAGRDLLKATAVSGGGDATPFLAAVARAWHGEVPQ